MGGGENGVKLCRPGQLNETIVIMLVLVRLLFRTPDDGGVGGGLVPSCLWPVKRKLGGGQVSRSMHCVVAVGL